MAARQACKQLIGSSMEANTGFCDANTHQLFILLQARLCVASAAVRSEHKSLRGWPLWRQEARAAPAAPPAATSSTCCRTSTRPQRRARAAQGRRRIGGGSDRQGLLKHSPAPFGLPSRCGTLGSGTPLSPRRPSGFLYEGHLSLVSAPQWRSWLVRTT